MIIRPTQAADLPALGAVLDDTELFPSQMLSEMIAGFLEHDGTQEVWLTCEAEGIATGFCFASPEEMTEGTWNMRAIAVHGRTQGTGCGGALTAQLEMTLAKAGARILLADTSGTDDFAATRAFYRKQGYTEEARIRDYWAAGDDKVVFRKALM